jgi:M6 family metalloprotease-like protein
MSMPFIEKTFTFTQPDGSTIQVRGTGNQFEARFETLDGQPVTRNPATGAYEYVHAASNAYVAKPSGIAATLPFSAELLNEVAPSSTAAELPPSRSTLDRAPTRWQARRAQRRALAQAMESLAIAPAPPQRQTVGTFVGLTLLIDFPDEQATISAAEVTNYCNQVGYTGFGNNGSVRDYFLEVSGGKLDYSNVVAPYYRAQHPRDYYTDPAVPYGVRAQELIYEALDHHLTAGFDFTPLTADDRDYVYALNVFYAGTKVNNWSEGLWPHASALRQAFQLPDGKQLSDYQITDIGRELTLGTFCHENGHMVCDFPDLYDYGNQSSGVGVFCLMCAGGSAASKKNPAHVGAYLKHAAGWSDNVQQVDSGATPSLRAGINEFAVLRRSRTEYFIIENRQRNGRDSALPGSGLAVWHVDEFGNNEYEQMTSANHYECSLIQADGRNDLERNNGLGDAGDLFHSGTANHLDANSAPALRWWDGTATGRSIRNIGPAGATMTFDVN